MGERQYVDFDLQIESSGEGYRARVIDSPVGQATVDFDIPLSEMEQENFILKLNRPRRGVRRIESQQMEAAKEFGGILFSSVFQGEVLGCLQSSMTEASKMGAGLRIRLRLSDAPDLLDLPWEFLYNRSLNRFLALSVDSPLVRYLDMPGYIAPLEVAPPLRVLVMISFPEDIPTLDTEEEWRKLKEAVRIALTVLNMLGVKFPSTPNKLDIMICLLGTTLMLRGKHVEDLRELPAMTDPDKLAAMRIMSSTTLSF